jgi:hypothetical protein
LKFSCSFGLSIYSKKGSDPRFPFLDPHLSGFFLRAASMYHLAHMYVPRAVAAGYESGEPESAPVPVAGDDSALPGGVDPFNIPLQPHNNIEPFLGYIYNHLEKMNL